MSCAVTIVISVVLFLFGGNLLKVFSSDTQVLHYATQMMHFLVPGYLCLAIAHTYCGVVRGAGYLNGSNACSDRKYVCSAHDLDYVCYAVCTQHHHRFSGVFSDMAHQRADHAGILSQIGLA